MSSGRLRLAATRRPTSLLVVLVIPLLAGLAPIDGSGSACAPNGGSEPAAEAQTEEKASVERDAIYHRTLRTTEALTSVWKQQPNNRAALRRYLVELRRDLSELAEAAGGEDATGPQPPGTPQEAGAAEVAPPAGPVPTSTEATPEQEARRREEATLGKFLPTPPIVDPLENRTLAGAEENAIRDACGRALEELAAIEARIESDDAEPRAVEAALAGLRAILFGMSEPAAQPTS